MFDDPQIEPVPCILPHHALLTDVYDQYDRRVWPENPQQLQALERRLVVRREDMDCG